MEALPQKKGKEKINRGIIIEAKQDKKMSIVILPMKYILL